MPDGVKSRKYYGILLMDGDRMGVRLTEPTSSDMNVGVDYHRGVSKSLHHFATTRVPELVGKFHGQLMYAGGDDVLALFPTDEIVGCADEIRKEFSKELALATMSAGITVVHISHPLREALDDARYAEKTAKNDLGRDAVSFRIVKRSGQILVSGGKWATNGMRLVEDFLTPMLSHVRLGKERTRKGISYKWVQDISHLSFVSPALPPDATLAELHRLFKRHAQDSSKDVWATTLQPWLQTQLPGHLDDAATMIDTAFYLGRGTDQ
jgi:CRISPR-associated protein Cmr2